MAVTAFTAYGISTASATVTTANQLVTTTGGTATNKNSLIGTAIGFGELYSQANTSAWAAASSIGAPSGHGFFYDTALSAMQFVAGTWTPTLTLNCSVGSLVCDLYVRAFIYASGVYTLIGTMLLAGQKLTTTTTTYAFSGTTLPASYTIPTAGKLYIDIWANITSNSTGSSTAVIRLEQSSTSAGAANNMQLVTPGYQTGPTLTPLTLYLTDVNATRLTIAELLVTSSTSGDQSGSSNIGSVMGWGEIGLGGPTTFGASAIGAPSGLGAFFDSTALENNLLIAGGYGGELTLSISQSSAAVIGNLVLRYFKYNVNTETYTAIGSITLSSQSINSTSALVFSFPTMSLPHMAFETGSSLYVDAWMQITSNTMSSTGNLLVYFSTSATQGYTGAQFVTPGYQTGPTVDKDILWRTRIAAIKFSDVATRLALQSPAIPKNIAFRLIFQYPQSTWDVITRTRVSAIGSRDWMARVRLFLTTQRDLPLRILLASTPAPHDVPTRTVLAAFTTKMIGLRTRLLQTVQRDVFVRTLLQAQTTKDWMARIRIGRGTAKDWKMRAVTSAVTLKSIMVRLGLHIPGSGDLSLRLGLQSLPLLKDASLRLLFYLQHLSDVMLRTRLSAGQSRDIQIRTIFTLPATTPATVGASTIPTYQGPISSLPLSQLPPGFRFIWNGFTLDIPDLVTAPPNQGGYALANSFFTLTFNTPSAAMSAALVTGAQGTMTFLLADGTPMQAPVQVVLALLGGTELLVTFQVLQNTAVFRRVVYTPFF